MYGVEANSVFGIDKKTMGSMDTVLKFDSFDPLFIGQCTRLARPMFGRSMESVAKRIGALNDMCVRINRPRESEVGNPLHFLSRITVLGRPCPCT